MEIPFASGVMPDDRIVPLVAVSSPLILPAPASQKSHNGNRASYHRRLPGRRRRAGLRSPLVLEQRAEEPREAQARRRRKQAARRVAIAL